MFVGASNVPSVERANAEVVADCSTVNAAGDTTAQLPAPLRVRCATKLAVLLIRTASAACSSPTKVAVPDTVAWLYVNSVAAKALSEARTSWSISAVISCANAAITSASTSIPCCD